MSELTAAQSNKVFIKTRPKRLKRAAVFFKPYLFILPALLFIGFWLYRPLVETFKLSFCDWNMIPGTTPEYVGLENFIRLIKSHDFGLAIKNTAFYILFMFPFTVVIPIFLANATQGLHNTPKRIYRALLFIPMIMAPVVVSAIFRWLLLPDNGLVNNILTNLGVLSQNSSKSMFADQVLAKWVILFITGWKMIGFSTILFSAALTNVDRQYYEAAALEGSTGIRAFWDITLPLISPTIIFMIMMTILFTSQVTFVFIDTLTQGGPMGTSTNIFYQMYKFGFKDLNVGMSAAAGVLFFVVFGILGLVLTSISRKYSFYDNQ